MRVIALLMIVLLAVSCGGEDLPPPSAIGAGDCGALLGRVINAQRLPIPGVEVRLDEAADSARVATTRDDGWFVLEVCDAESAPVPALLLVRRHYESQRLELTPSQLSPAQGGGATHLGEVVLTRHHGLAFWATLLTFLLMMTLIGTTAMHNALAALLGASLLLATSAFGRLVNDDLVIYDFGQAVGAIDWNVVFLIMGMMIVIAVVEGTGVFRWLAYFAFKRSGGQLWKLMLILMVLTAVSSAVLDNVTTMLLMTPITIRIAIAMNIDPLSLLMPEILAANVGGLSTMVGTPTNILIASYSKISFTGFLFNLTPGVLLALAGVAGYSLWRYRSQTLSTDAEISEELVARLRDGAVIKEPDHLKKAGWIGAAMLVLFVAGESVHAPPAVIAILGATALLIWIKPDVEQMIEAVDWTTLVFFIALFMVIGGLREVGIIDQIAVWVSALVGHSQLMAMVAITVFSALISTVIPNIPFTATMLPVVGYLTATIPEVGPESLYFCLAVGAAMGGNGSLVGASANLVTAGIAERAGYPITFGHFFKVGFPALLISVTLALGWLLLRFMVF